jgi:hypothetical protein
MMNWNTRIFSFTLYCNSAMLIYCKLHSKWHSTHYVAFAHLWMTTYRNRMVFMLSLCKAIRIYSVQPTRQASTFIKRTLKSAQMLDGQCGTRTKAWGERTSQQVRGTADTKRCRGVQIESWFLYIHVKICEHSLPFSSEYFITPSPM